MYIYYLFEKDVLYKCSVIFVHQKKKMSLVSVIVPCYNQAQFLNETLESVFLQTYTNWECIIVNDGSLDNTEEIAKEWIERDQRFHYFSKENGGLSSARNFGLDKSNGKYIQFLDSDDCLDTRKIELSINEIQNNDAKIVISDFKRFRKSRKKLKSAFCNLKEQEFTYNSILTKWDVEFSIPIHCALFSNDIIGNIRFNESLKAKEDWLFWLTVFKGNPKVYFLNKVLVFYRIHKMGMTRNFQLMETNLQKAYSLIYNSLNDEYKFVFFNRITLELSASRNKHQNYKNNLFYKKIINFIK